MSKKDSTGDRVVDTMAIVDTISAQDADAKIGISYNQALADIINEQGKGKGSTTATLDGDEVMFSHSNIVAKTGVYTHYTSKVGKVATKKPLPVDITVDKSGIITLNKGYFGDVTKNRKVVRFIVSNVLGLPWRSRYDNIALKVTELLAAI